MAGIKGNGQPLLGTQSLPVWSQVGTIEDAGGDGKRGGGAVEKPPEEKRCNGERFAKRTRGWAFLEGLQSGHIIQCSKGSGSTGQERAASFHGETGFEPRSTPLHCTTRLPPGD